jgi:trans-aconitate 2-methyltransferase
MTEWNASEYARISTLQAAMAEEVLALLDLKGNERILDVGCGNGKTTAEIAARVPQGAVVGVDASADMIAFAAAHGALHPNLQFAVADARQLAYHHEFDLVVSFNALHWIPDQDRALRSMRATLKDTGLAQLRLVPKGERKSRGQGLGLSVALCFSGLWKRHFRGVEPASAGIRPSRLCQ